jgi:CheY-like chemotaxis protein
MDWKMPGIDGIEAARKIKQDTKLTHIPAIIMMTAFGKENMLKQAEAEGIINSFLMKPTNASNLFDTIVEVFGKQVSTTSEIKISSDEKSVREKIGGARVLLSEDNAINQQVATEILQSVGLIVEIANNGKEALEAINKSNYDLILMDIQMPVMSGYEATRLIRQDQRFKDLPIIAMTAHAISGAKEQCLEEGMNDYVSKPVDPSQLFSVLIKWIKPGIRNAVKDIEAEYEKSKEQSIIVELPEKIAGIDLPSGLRRVNGNKKLFRKLLMDFAGNYAFVTEEINGFINQGDLDTALRLAHTLKGVAGNISANSIQVAASDLETSIANKNTGKYKELLSELDRVLQPAIAELKCMGRKSEDKTTLPDKPIDHATVRVILLQLMHLLRKNDPDAEKCMEVLKENIGSSMFHEEIAAMGKHIGNFDFDLALISLAKIMGALNISLDS